MANSFKQQKAFVLRTPVGFPAKNLEKCLVELQRSVELKCRGKPLAFGSDVATHLPVM